MGKIAFLFAGQGAQVPGMGKELCETSPAAADVFAAAERLCPGTRRLCFEGPADALRETLHTQPCLFTVDLACARALEERGVNADGAAGFSLGELPAAAFAGHLSDERAFRLTCVRAEAMQRCAEMFPGVMLAVLKLTAEETEALCREVGGAWPVNYNAPGQTVAACSAERAEALKKAAAAHGGRAVALAVSGAFHCPLMDGAGAELAAYLANEHFRAPRIPLYANATAQPYKDDAAELLARQVNHPVLWQRTVENMRADGFDTFIEVGAGTTLAGLVRRIDASARTLSVNDPASLEAALAEVEHA